MATLVDRPQPLHLLSMPLIPQRRSRHEIIDVDSLEEEVGQPARNVRSRSIEVIDISDDDEEEQEEQVVINVDDPAAISRLISPPPRFSVSPIPPVPALPAELRAHASLPMRRNPPRHPSSLNSAVVHPPVRAHNRPFVELPATSRGAGTSSSGASSSSSSRRRSSGSSRASSPVVLPPHLGLGGALISDNNARLERERRDREQRMRLSEIRARQRASLRAAQIRGTTQSGWRMGALNIADLYFDAGLMDPRLADFFGDAFPRPQEVDYKKEYTHQGQPEPGFTFSFSVSSEDDAEQDPSNFPTTSVDNPIIIDLDDEDDGKSRLDKGKGKAVAPAESSLSLKTTLVCSHCRDPLLLGESASKLGQDVEGTKRIWSLRCGHLIDGKCLETLSTPPPVDIPADPKGKGKAKASAPQPFDDHVPSIRSRLRSYTPSLSSFNLFGSTPATRAPKKPVIEDTHEWECPVASCRRRHTTVKIAGVWGPAKPEMNKGDGAIGVFV